MGQNSNPKRPRVAIQKTRKIGNTDCKILRQIYGERNLLRAIAVSECAPALAVARMDGRLLAREKSGTDVCARGAEAVRPAWRSTHTRSISVR